MFKTLKHYYQRCKLGYSYQDTWSIHDHLNTIMPPMLRQLKKGWGCPCDFWDKEAKDNECHLWYDALETMAQGFEASEALDHMWSVDTKKISLLEEKRDKGLNLFVKHYQSLWD